jgi:nitronate monooxygenase/enoyl-[acyl-carrier protein] reductase II
MGMRGKSIAERGIIMLRTDICNLLGIEFPIIQAGMGIFTSAELVAAVSNAGGLGSLGTGFRTAVGLMQELQRIRELTDHPFALNYVIVNEDKKIFDIILEAKPPLISFALGDPGDFAKRAHDNGSLVMHQVNTVQQAKQAAASGVDIIAAQGSEAGGFSGTIASLVLISQIVAAVHPIPVVAAGGIADGTGLAAALVLGAQGANIGTRFLASAEAPVSDTWKQAIISAESEDAVKVEFWDDIFPANPKAYKTTSRAVRTPFIEKWQQEREAAKEQAATLRGEIVSAMQQGRLGDLVPWAGQAVGLVHEVMPAAEIVRRIASESQSCMEKYCQNYQEFIKGGIK